MARIDLTGDGRSDLVVTSPWGLGVMSWNGTSLASPVMAQNGSRIGEWLLDTAANNVELKADVDGDGVAEVLLASPWGIGVASFAGGTGRTRAMAANGTRLGGWIVDTANNRFLHGADVDGDGRDEIVVTSPWGIGVLALRPGGLTSVMLAPNGTRFGGWLLNTADNWFPAVGDFDGDGRDEIVVTSPWGIGILRFEGASLTSIAMVPNGTVIGGWVVQTAADRVEAVADFTGSGKAQLLVSSPSGVSVVGFSDGGFEAIAHVAAGAAAGSWVMDPVHDNLSVVGDVDRDGRAEIVVTSDWGLGVLEVVEGTLRSQLMAGNGTRLGEWLLNTRDNRLRVALDVDGDGADEIVVTSPWGLGILRLGADPGTAAMLAPNGTRFGGWNLNTADNDWAAGHGQSWAVVVHHPDWGYAVGETIPFLRRRGYAVLETAVAAEGLEMIRRLSRAVRATDRVFIYLAGHGATQRAVGDDSRLSALTHLIQFGDGDIVWLRDLAPLFESIADKGADLSVFDGSCNAGETVMAASGQRYVAMATTGSWSPGLTNTPNPAAIMAQFGRPSRFGMWWSREDAASRLSGITPHRFYQKVYRSDDTEIARWSVLYKPAISFYPAVAGSWDLLTRNCALFRYVYADVYAQPDKYPEVKAHKAAAKISLDDYLTWMKSDYAGYSTSIARLRAMLAERPVLDRAAAVYAAAYPRPWQTIVADLTWDVAAQPTKELESKTVLEPRLWAGSAGFHALVAESLRLMGMLEGAWSRQEALLRQLNSRILRDQVFEKFDIDLLHKVPTIEDMRRRSEFEVERRVERMQLLTQLAAGEGGLLGGIGDLRIEGIEGAERLGPVGDEGPALRGRERKVRVPRDQVVDGRALERDAREGIVLERAALTHVDVRALDHDALVAPIAAHLIETVHTWVLDRTAADLIAELRAIDTANWVALDRLHYYLTIVEEAVSRAQETGTQAGDLVSF